MTIAIIGPGLIGRSVALAATRAHAAITVLEIDRGDPLEEVHRANLVVLAAPVDVILALLREHADLLRGRVTVDTGSTKRAIVAAARAAGLTSFVGGHPMAGAASRGPAAARADLFDRRPWFLVPGDATTHAVETVREFITTLGAVPVLLDDDGSAHDAAMAAVSHLPQVVAAALMITAADAAGQQLSWAGAGLRDTTRLAESSGEVWQSILATNGDLVAPLLRQLARDLELAASRLDAGESLENLFARANRARAALTRE